MKFPQMKILIIKVPIAELVDKVRHVISGLTLRRGERWDETNFSNLNIHSDWLIGKGNAVPYS